MQVAVAVIAVGCLIAVVLLALVGWFGADRAMRPPREVDPAALQGYPFAATAEAAPFASRDGTPLVGWFIPGGGRAAATVILLHGYGQSRADMLPHAAYLHAAGYNTLLFDFRGSGESGGDAVTFGIKEPLDVLGALDFLAARPDVDPARIAVQGVSMGAADGLLAAADDPRITTVVAESAFADLDGMIARNFRQYIGLPAFPFAPAIVFAMERRVGGSAGTVNPVAAARRLGHRPLFVIDDADDTLNPPDSGAALLAAAGGPKEWWRIPGAGHAGGYGADPAGYARRVVAFYGRYLP